MSKKSSVPLPHFSGSSPWLAQGGPRAAQGDPRSTQDDPRWPPWVHLGTQDFPKSAQDGSLGHLGPALGQSFFFLAILSQKISDSFLRTISEQFWLPKWTENGAKIRPKIDPIFCPVCGYVFDSFLNDFWRSNPSKKQGFA